MPTVAEDVAFGPLNLGLTRDEVRARVRVALAAVRMEPRGRTGRRTSSRSASGGGWRSRPCSPCGRGCSCSTSRRPTSTRAPGASCSRCSTASTARCSSSPTTCRSPRSCASAPCSCPAGRVVADGPCAEILADEELLAAHDLELPEGFDLGGGCPPPDPYTAAHGRRRDAPPVRLDGGGHDPEVAQVRRRRGLPGDELVEIETDKANMTYEADQDGTLKIVAQEGDTLPVGETIAQIGGGSDGASRRAGGAPKDEEEEERRGDEPRRRRPRTRRPATPSARRAAATAGRPRRRRRRRRARPSRRRAATGAARRRRRWRGGWRASSGSSWPSSRAPGPAGGS